MSDRRRLLLTLLNQGVWLPYSFEYLYHDLIPTTISGKNVKNKLKLATIYGNSVVENQLVQNGDFSNGTNNFTAERGTISVSNNTLTITRNDTSGRLTADQSNINIVINHNYLITYEIKVIQNSLTTEDILISDSGDRFSGSVLVSKPLENGKTYFASKIITAISSGNTTLRFFRINNGSIGDSYEIRNVMFIDLTQMFPFDTPTTLTDNRVQAILNNGYIPYNTGTIENTDIGEFESEPYNLFDEEWQQGDINQITGELYNTGNNIRSTNLNSVIGGQTYTFEWDRTSCNTAVGGYTYLYIYEYDKNGNYIYFNDANHSGITVDNKQLTLTNETAYVRVKIYSSGSPAYSSLTKDIIKLCVHRTGTRTGYAPHTNPQTIQFKYQGSGVGTSHDTMEIGKDNVVFTKDRAVVDLSTINWNGGNGYYFSLSSGDIRNLIKKPETDNDMPNMICSTRQVYSKNYVDTYGDGICVAQSGSLVVDNSSWSYASQINGMLEYQLATPQTITIPRKKLGVVDLGSLEWTYNSNGFFISAYSIANIGGKLPSSSDVQINAYCSQFLNATFNQVYDNSKDMSFGVNDIGSLIIRNNAFGTNATDFKNAMSGQYLFYETENEVADIVDTIGVEAGGTFTSDSEVLPNVDTKIKGK